MSTAVYIGRFQPFHRGHLHVIEEALKDERINKLIVKLEDICITL